MDFTEIYTLVFTIYQSQRYTHQRISNPPDSLPAEPRPQAPPDILQSPQAGYVHRAAVGGGQQTDRDRRPDEDNRQGPDEEDDVSHAEQETQPGWLPYFVFQDSLIGQNGIMLGCINGW